MDRRELVKKAFASAMSLESGRVFCLKDLFLGAEWNSFCKGDRLSLGSLFKNEVLSHPELGIVYVGKAQNNSAQYRKGNMG